MKRYISYIFLLLMLASCTSKKEVREEVENRIGINLSDMESVVFSDFFTHVNYTLLQKKDSFLIGDVERMKVGDGKLAILTSNKVLVFNINTGSAFLNIDRKGQQPYGYTSLFDVLIDPDKAYVELLDMNGQKIQRYDYKGAMLEEVHLPFRSFAFHKKNNDSYLFYNGNLPSEEYPYQLIDYNVKEKRVADHYFPIDEHQSTYFFIIDGNNFNSASSLTFISSPQNTLYEIEDNGTLVPQYIIDFGKNQPPASFYEESYRDIADFADKAAQNGYVYNLINVAENDQYIFLSNRLDTKTYWSVYDREAGKLMTNTAVLDDVAFKTEIPLVSNNTFTIDANYFYFLLQPDQFIALMERKQALLGDDGFESFMESRPSLREIYEHPQFDESANPILVSCRFRKSFLDF